MELETECPDCGATGLHGCTGKKYPGSDSIVMTNLDATKIPNTGTIQIGEEYLLIKDGKVSTFSNPRFSIWDKLLTESEIRAHRG